MLRRHGGNSQDPLPFPLPFMLVGSFFQSRPSVIVYGSLRHLLKDVSRSLLKEFQLGVSSSHGGCTTFASKSRSLAIDVDVMRQSAS